MTVTLVLDINNYKNHFYTNYYVLNLTITHCQRSPTDCVLLKLKT